MEGALPAAHPWFLRFALLLQQTRAILVLRLLLLYRLAVVKRSRVKLAAFFCARPKSLALHRHHRKQLKTA
jgi:hypothetical protein